ncbi:MAG TPA: ABC transporter substrate-binding protein [bacterium]|nr:ABC transporter substrate-binding protein [bacterium]
MSTVTTRRSAAILHRSSRPWGGLTFVLAALLALLVALPMQARAETMKIGIVTFLSGAAAGPFGIPGRNGAELTVDAINSGSLPSPYNTKGIGGANVEAVIIDEAGGTTKVVEEFRNLVQREHVDAVVGYISSGSCLAIAPVAEELKMLTVFFDCGTPRIFEDGNYKYVFRTSAHSTMDNVGAAHYVAKRFPKTRSYAGINQNYAWGQDSWRDFHLSMELLMPKAKVTTVQWPKLFAGQYSSEISALLVSNSNIVHSSLWDGDLESFVFQAGARGLAKRSKLVLTTGEANMFRMGAKMPNGVIIGARGPYGVLARDTALNRWFQKTYTDHYGTPPVYPSYQMAQAILGLKVAYDKTAQKMGGKFPTREQAIPNFEHLTYEAFGTTVNMALGNGHQAITETAYGQYHFDKAAGRATITNVERFPAECVNPPVGVKSEDWIKGGLKGAKCN